MRIINLKIKENIPNGKIIQNISFNKKGLNLIVDDSEKKGNNVGKTTVLRIIDICLGARHRKFIYFDSETQATNLKLKKYIHESLISAVLTIEKDSKSHVLEVELFEKGKRKIDNIEKGETEYNKTLKKLIFSNVDDKPTFRELIPKFVRIDQKGDNSKFIKYLTNGGNVKKYEAIYSFLFRFAPPEEVSNKLQLKSKIDELEKDIKKLGKFHGFKNKGELEQKLNAINSTIKNLENSLETQIDAEKFKEREEDTKKIRLEYQEMRDKLNELEFEQKYISDILNNEKKKQEKSSLDKKVLETLYTEVVGIFDGLNKTFDELIEFNKQLSTNKINYYNRLLKETNDKINLLEKEKDALFMEEKDKIISVKVEDIDEYYNLKKELDDYYERRGAVSEIIASIEKLEEQKKNFDDDLKEYPDEEEIQKTQLEAFNEIFRGYSKKINGSTLFIYLSENGIPAVGDLDSGLGTGTRKALISSFDISYYEFSKVKEIDGPKFLIHDVLETMETESLENMIDIIKTNGCQYIVAVLNEKIKDNKKIEEKDKILTLNKEDKLFKM